MKNSIIRITVALTLAVIISLLNGRLLARSNSQPPSETSIEIRKN